MQTFDNEEQAINIANDCDPGLASYLFSENINCCIRVAEAFDHGMVGINESLISAVKAPFGGVKHSGLDREGGEEGLVPYQQTKYPCTNIS